MKRYRIKLAAMLAAAAALMSFGIKAAATYAEPASEAAFYQAGEEITEPEKTEPIAINSGKITLRYASYTYKGAAVRPDARVLSDGSVTDELTVKVNGKKLVKGTDFTLTYRNNTRPGTATVTATGIGAYTGKITRTFVVKPATNAITTLETGNGITVNFGRDTKADGYQILYSTDRTFKTYHSTTVWDVNKTFVNLTNVPKIGEKYYIKMRSFVVSGGKRYGNYSSLHSKTVKGSVRKITIPHLEYTYLGRALVPSVKVWNKAGQKLVEGRDYTCKITNATNVGAATITVKGKGNYIGTKTKTFKVIKADIGQAKLSGLAEAYSYTGKALKPSVVLKYRSKTLVNGTDYTVSYSNNTEIGTATIKITGKGNFKGTASKTFRIERTGWDTEGGYKVYYYKGKKISGLYTISSNSYYFDEKGRMQTGWQKIGDYYYCFDRLNGKMVKSTTMNKIKVGSDGKAKDLSAYDKQRIATMMHAHQIMLEQTDPTDSMADKRYKVFKWVQSHSYHQWRFAIHYYYKNDEWDILFANDVFSRGGGCCVSDASATAFLFTEIGYSDIWLCINDIGHGYLVVDGRLYDPLIAEGNWNPNYNGNPSIQHTVHKIRIDQ